MMRDDMAKIMLTEEQLHDKVCELGAQISRDYEGKNLLLVSVLKGSVLFMADLMRAIKMCIRDRCMSAGTTPLLWTAASPSRTARCRAWTWSSRI